MEWTVVAIKQTSGKNAPFVSIGNGRLEFNAAACDLIDDHGQYRYVQLLTAKEKGKTVVAAKFLQEAEPNTISIKRKKNGETPIKGMTVANKGVISDLFSEEIGENNKMGRYTVEKIGDNMLKILV